MRKYLLLAVLFLFGLTFFENVSADTKNVCEENPRGSEWHIFVPVQVGARVLQALVDTGATATYVAPCVLESLPSDVAQKSENTAKITLGDGRLSESTIWTIVLTIGPHTLKTPVYVTENLPDPIIVGMDILVNTDAIVLPALKTVFFPPTDKVSTK